MRSAHEHEHGRANPNGDAAVLVSAIESRHPEPFRAVDRDTLLREAARVDALDSDVPSVVAVELMRLIALLGARNGHTAIHPLGEHRSTLHAFPLWLYEFDDGVFVVDAEQSDLVGTELIAVEGVDLDEVLAAVSPLIAYDNEFTIRARRPTFVVNASVLRGLGLVDESAQATFRMRTRNGSVVDATLDAIATGDLLKRFGGDRGLGRPGPAYLRRRGDWHWAEVAADGHAVHVGYNITRGDVTDFALEVEALAGPSRVAIVMLDLRQNGGGDNRTYRPLLESLARLGSEKRLAVLTSRLTFSAAMQLIVELERETQAVFVGEPTGGSPNQYGDATKVELPNSGLNAFVATVAWKTAGELDDRITRMPDIPVRQSSTAFFAGNDPVLDQRWRRSRDSVIAPPWGSPRRGTPAVRALPTELTRRLSCRACAVGSATMSNVRIRPLTIGFLLLAAGLVAIGVVYFTKTAAELPGFFPGHAAHSTRHHLKHGVAMITLALLALGAAWFTTAPEHSPD